MKKLLCMLILIAPLYAQDGKIDLPLLMLRKFKVSSASDEICQDPHSEKCKKQAEDIDSFVKDSLCLIDIMQNFNPKASVPQNSKETWVKQKENIPFLWKTVEARHTTGLPVTSMQKYEEAYELASEAYGTVISFLTLGKLIDAKDQISFSEYVEKSKKLSKKTIDMQIEVFQKSIKECQKLKQEIESNEKIDPRDTIAWAAQHIEEVEQGRKSYEKAKEEGAAKERQRQADSK